MEKKDKDLLLKDLCARLPYGVKVACNKNVYTVNGLDLIVTDEGDWEYAVTAKGIAPIEIDFIKPYLLPLSSMTEEQKNDCPIGETNLNIIKSNIGYGIIEIPWQLSYLFIDWCNKNHFDYRGLIPMGIAINATGKNIY